MNYLFFLSLWLIPVTAMTQTARVQVIHNSPDALASEVDVYLNDALLIDNFAFRSASPFIDAPAGMDFTVGIAPANSNSVADAIATFPFNLTAGETYIIVASGIVSPNGYTPLQPFNLEVFSMGREVAAVDGNTDVLVYHGSTDAPTVDVIESLVTAGATIVNDASYGDFAGYLELATTDYRLEVRDATGTVTVASYEAPLATLGLQNQALTVLASGFLDPSQNSNGPAFGLYVALPIGGDLIPLPLTPAQTARVQVIHNSPDALASEVDVYLNDDLLLDNFAFRTATPFVDVPAGVDFAIGVAPSTSTSVNDVLASFTYNLAPGGTYILVADGLVVPFGYNPPVPFSIEVYDAARETATMAGNTDVLVHHGSTDAPTVDVVETGLTGGATIVDNLAYGQFAGYLELATADYRIDVRDESGTVTVATYDAPLNTLGLSGAALTVVASGFLNPAVNANSPAFGLYVALPSGGDLIPLPLVITSTKNIIRAGLNVYPNPANEHVILELSHEEAIVTITHLDGKEVVVPIVRSDRSARLDVSGLTPGMYTLLVAGKDISASSLLHIVR